MPSSHLILCHPLLLLPPIPPSIRVSSSVRAQVVSAVKGRRKALGTPSPHLPGDQEVAPHPPTACPRLWSHLSTSFPTIPSVLILTVKQEDSCLQLSTTDRMRGSGCHQVSGVMSRRVTKLRTSQQWTIIWPKRGGRCEVLMTTLSYPLAPTEERSVTEETNVTLFWGNAANSGSRQ